jgi:hypothetical protein
MEHKRRPQHMTLKIQVLAWDRHNNIDIARIVDHHCLEVIVLFIDIGRIVDHHCLEVIVHFIDIGGIVDHHCLEMIVHFIDIARIVDHHGQQFHQYQ